MFNPSYLIQSRHSIFYFRYPIGNKRVSVSLKTRCPKKALKLARLLEYHSANLIENMDLERMNHADAIAIIKDYFTHLLELKKGEIDQHGPLSRDRIAGIEETLEDWYYTIASGADDIMEAKGIEYDDPEDHPMDSELGKVIRHTGADIAIGTKEYAMLKSSYKYVERNYLKDLLAYNSRLTDFSMLEAPAVNSPVSKVKTNHQLGIVLESYLAEIKPTLAKRSYEEQRGCLAYLIDWLGADFQIAKLDDAKARDAKDILRATPRDRNKLALTKGLPIIKQVDIAKKHNLPTLGTTSIKKYLGYFNSFLGWAKRNRYVSANSFTGMTVKGESKKALRRQMFKKEEINKILENLGNEDLVKNQSNYWGAMIAVYTGARRNEIAGLLPEDVKKDHDSGIWYFDITDEQEDGKSLKTDASKRVVPIHSRLLERGFLEFVEESRVIGNRANRQDGRKTRLLHHLTYTDNEQWGRNLGRWMNETYLPILELKTPKKSLHSLRHSLITHLSMAKVEVATIKSIVGHEPDTVTTETYTHYGVGHLPAFKDALEKLPY